MWVAGDDLDGVDEKLADVEEEEEALDDADDDAEGVAWGLRLLDFVVGGERVGVAVVVAVSERVRLPLCGGVGAAVLDGLAEEEPEEEALADDEGVEVGVAWGLRLLVFVVGGERVGVTVTADEPVGVGLVLRVAGPVAEGDVVANEESVAAAEEEEDAKPEGEPDGEAGPVGVQVGVLVAVAAIVWLPVPDAEGGGGVVDRVGVGVVV